MHTRIGRLFAVAASFMLVATALAVAKPPVTLAAPPAHVTNPWAGAIQFKEPVWQGQVESFAQAMDTANPALATAARGAEAQPTAIWLDSKAAVSGPNGNTTDLGAELNAAVAQQANTTTNPSGLPMVVNIVIYDLPGRDCAAYASNGEEVLTPVLTPADTAANDAVLADYKTNYISVIASYLASASYNNLRFALLIEPDSIGNVLTNTVQNPYGTSADIAARCSLAAPYYEKGVEAALGTFHPISNAYTFLDITNSSWLVWRMLGNPTTQFDAGGEYAKLAVAAGGFQTVDGFVTNVSNYQPVKEPFITAAQSLGIYTVSGASAYGGQKDIDELGFIADMRTEFMAAGFPSTVGFAIDTSRDGWGGQARPTAASTISVTSPATLDAYVNASKIDKSPDSSDWCNQSGAGLGARPAANPSIGIAGVSTPSYLWSFLWVKPPGQSDGASNSGATGYDPNCDPAHVDPIKKIVSGALPNTPHAGTFNNTQFAELLLNAYPSLGAVTIVPGAPTNVTASWSSGLFVSWTAPASNGGSAITGYTVTSSPSAGSCTTGSSQNFCSWMSPNFTPGTIYTFTVTATNAVGTGPASSPSNGVTPPLAAPWPPVGLSVVAGNGQATLRWVAPPSNGGSAITGYTVTASPGGRTCTTTGLSCTVTGLTNGTSYTLTVTARNSVGTSGGASTSVTPVATATAPGAPTGVTGTAGNASATINWVAPASNGGSTITGYVVTASNGQTCTSGVTQLICVFSGLTNGTSYTFTVKATNAVGTSVASAASNAVTPTAGTATCSAKYTLNSSWSTGTNANGYSTNLVVTNTGTSATKSWTVTWTWANSQTVTSPDAKGTFSLSGTTETVRSVTSSAAIPGGQALTLTFGGTYGGNVANNAISNLTCSAT